MELECLLELDRERREEWTRFLRDADHQHPRQCLEFADVERAAGRIPLFVIGRMAGEVRGIGLFSLRPHWANRRWSKEAISFSGPVMDDLADFEAFLRAVAVHPAFRRVGRVVISPYWLNDDARRMHDLLKRLRWRSAEETDFRQTGVIALERPEGDIFASFSKSARREIRRAERQNVEVIRARTPEEARCFFECLNRLHKSKGLKQVSPTEADVAFSSIYSNDRLGTILTAHADGVFLGGILINRSRKTAHGRHFATDAKALSRLSNLRLAPLVWYAGLKWAREQGCVRFDVEGYKDEIDKADKLFQIYQYKREFSPRATLRVSEYQKCTNILLNFNYLVNAGIRKRGKRFLLWIGKKG